jgi:hypothetical protein
MPALKCGNALPPQVALPTVTVAAWPCQPCRWSELTKYSHVGYTAGNVAVPCKTSSTQWQPGLACTLYRLYCQARSLPDMRPTERD